MNPFAPTSLEVSQTEVIVQNEPESSESRGHYLCEACGRFHQRHGMCSRCPDEPLVDVRDEVAMRLVRERDQRRHFKRLARFTLLSIAIMVPLNALCVAATFSLFVLSLDYTEALIELTPLWLLGHVGLFGVSVVYGEQWLDARFPMRRISALVDGTSEEFDVPSRGIRERLSDFMHIVTSSRRAG